MSEFKNPEESVNVGLYNLFGRRLWYHSQSHALETYTLCTSQHNVQEKCCRSPTLHIYVNDSQVYQLLLVLEISTVYIKR